MQANSNSFAWQIRRFTAMSTEISDFSPGQDNRKARLRSFTAQNTQKHTVSICRKRSLTVTYADYFVVRLRSFCISVTTLREHNSVGHCSQFSAVPVIFCSSSYLTCANTPGLKIKPASHKPASQLISPHAKEDCLACAPGPNVGTT